MAKDLTRGNVFSSIVGFSVPIFLANVFQQLYNMADSFIVGRFVGKTAFAAVGSTGSINFLILGFVLGMCTGVTIPVAQRFGAGDYSGMRRKITDAMFACIVMGIVITALSAVMTGSMLRWMKTPDDIYRDAYNYIFIIFLGIPTLLMYNLPANISRALGDSKTPLYFLLLSAGLNVVLDIIGVCVLHLGVRGTAIATVTSQLVSGLACIFYMRKKYEKLLTFDREELEIRPYGIFTSSKIGMPMGFQFSITAIGTVVLQAAVNAIGSDCVAAINAANKINSIVTQPFEALGATMATYAGQNLGAGDIDRVKKGVRVSIVLSAIFAVAMFIVNTTFGTPISTIFLKKADINAQLIGYISKFLFINSTGFFLLGTLLILRNCLQGLGFSVAAMGAGLFEMVARTVIAFAAKGEQAYPIICTANVAAWIMANVILIPLYIWGVKRIKKVLNT